MVGVHKRTANGVSFLPIIIESNGYIHPPARQFFLDLAKQAALYRHIPWHNLYLFYLSLISVSLQSALYRSLLSHITYYNGSLRDRLRDL